MSTLVWMPVFLLRVYYTVFDTEIKLFLKNISKNPEEKNFYGEITNKIRVFCEYLYINHEKTKRKTLF